VNLALRGSVPNDKSARGIKAWELARANVRVGSKGDLTASKSDFRYTPDSGHRPTATACPKSADCVEKLEIRGASKISQMMHVGNSSRRKVCRIDTSVGSRFSCI
jgi:hypothetical protein